MNPEEFKNPGKSFRPFLFWAWNDYLDRQELRWQIRDFAEKGFGGYFTHSRIGLATSYLSDEWMKCIRACLEESKQTGLELWLYDEDRWPSGFAGGLIPAKNEKYRASFVSVREVKRSEVSKALSERSVLGVFEIEFSPSQVMNRFRQIREVSEIRGEGRLFLFDLTLCPLRGMFGEERYIDILNPPHVNRHSKSVSSFRYNDQSYVDLLNPRVTEEFLEVTLEAYAREFKHDLGKFIHGIFTDEPNYMGRNTIPWTQGLGHYLRELIGYDIIGKLPLLWFEGKGFRKVRYDFWRAVTQRFIESYTRPYSERCEALGLKMTGHLLYEDNLDFQVRHAGAVMPHYEFMHLPGVDHLDRAIENPLTLKQCASVAHQFGRNRVLSELFGCSGQSITFEDMKWISDWHFALGINFFCIHLTLYTMKGEAKRDYPPTFSYHQPYWEHLKLFNDYLARASYLCSQGISEASILVLHPIGSAWTTFSHTSKVSEDQSAELALYNDALVQIQDHLLALHWNFDFGDETILSRHGHIRRKELVVKESRYEVVIVPPSLTWSAEMVNLLEGFLSASGNLIFIGETPSLIDGEAAEARWRRILSNPHTIRLSETREDLAKALDGILPRSISILDEEGKEIEDILAHHRVDGDNHIYFLANKSRTKKHETLITFFQEGQVTEWNMVKGLASRVKAVAQQGKTVIDAVFHPTGSHAYVINTSKPRSIDRAPESPLTMKKTAEKITILSGKWSFSRLHFNSLVLDTCQYSFGDTDWSDKTHIWKVRRRAWEQAGLERYTGIQPWVLKKKNIKSEKPFQIRIRTTFKSEVESKQIYLVLEKASVWELLVNGKAVSTEVSEWYWDKQFGKVDLSSYIRIGENCVELSCTYDFDIPIENLHLIGDFGVKKVSEKEYVVTQEPEALRNGDWVEQGYPFYVGTMQYKAEFNLHETKPTRRVLIRLPEARGTLFLVRVNGGGSVPICWHPLEADVTKLVRKGINKLAIEVVGSLRNTFGPLHNKLGDLKSVKPRTFVDETNWTDTYKLVPYGLIGGVHVVEQEEPGSCS